MARMRSANVADRRKPAGGGRPRPWPRWAGEPFAASESVSTVLSPESDATSHATPPGSRRSLWLSQRLTDERRPMAFALLVSLAIHALLLTITFSGQALSL